MRLLYGLRIISCIEPACGSLYLPCTDGAVSAMNGKQAAASAVKEFRPANRRPVEGGAQLVPAF
jgi:hypothetical protein